MLLPKFPNLVLGCLIIVACTNYAIFVTTRHKRASLSDFVLEPQLESGDPRDPVIASTVHLICRDTPGRHCLGSTKGDVCLTNKVYGHYSCKASCALCGATADEISADLGLPVRLVDGAVSCSDQVTECPTFKASDRCAKDPAAMLQQCRKTCGFCDVKSQRPRGSTRCADDLDICPYMAATGRCTSGMLWVLPLCRQSCNSCTLFPNTHQASSTNIQRSTTARTPKQLASQDPIPSAHSTADQAGKAQADDGLPSGFQWLPVACYDTDAGCAGWHDAGECGRNPGFMAQACQLTCGSCRVAWTKQPAKSIQLTGSSIMPAVGFGTAGLGDSTGDAVRMALEAGYRHFDSAQAREWYREDLVGQALMLWLAATGTRREDLFLVSKLHPRHHGYDSALQQFESSLRDLGTSYLDLFLLHYPLCWGSLCGGTQPQGTWQDSWRALEALVNEGKIRSIGVSNFDLQQMQELLAVARVPPAVLQVNSDPSNPNHALQRFCQQHGIQFVAYSSLGTQWLAANGGKNPVLGNPLLKAIAAGKQRSVVQVVLRWALQLGQTVIPRSANQQHITENLQLFDFTLEETEMRAIYEISTKRQ